MTKVAALYGRSDVGMRKLCHRHAIPTPPLGYWAKVQAGKRARQPPFSGAAEQSLRIPVLEGEARCGARDSEAVLRQKAFEAEPMNRIVVAEVKRLSRAVARLGAELKASGRFDYGRQRSPAQGFVIVQVTPAAQRRALLLLEAVVRAAKARGFSLEPAPTGEARRDALRVHGEDFQFRLRERMNRSPHVPTKEELREAARDRWRQPPPYDYAPAGELVLEVEGDDLGACRKRWRDTPKHRLDDVLGEMFVELVRLAELRQAQRQRLEEQRRQAADEARRREALRRQQEAERARWRQLEEDAANWSKAEQIRAYVAAVQHQGSALANDALLTWTRWALRHADRLDPRLLVDGDEP